MRVFDMRLIAFATLILLTAAMPANCAEEPFAYTLRDVSNEAPTFAPIDQVLD
jgi:hypothetical protein